MGRAQVAYRYSLLTNEDWGGLVENWEKDDEKREERRQRQRRRDRDPRELEEEVKLRKEVLGLMSSGQVGKAVQRVTSNGIADPRDSSVLNQLKAKFPQRRDRLPQSVPKVAPIESFKGLRESLLSQEPGKSPGSGGMRPEYLVVLGEKLEDQDISIFEKFGL